MRVSAIFKMGFLLLPLLAGCDGGGSSTLPLPPSTLTSADDQTIPLSSTSTRAHLPSAGGYSATAIFPPVVSPASLKVAAANKPPAGQLLPSRLGRRPQSGTLSVFYYLEITSSTTVTFPTLPSFTLSLPPTFSTSGEQFYYAISQPVPAGVHSQYRTEGPGDPEGSAVGFDATAAPLTLTAGTKYTFAFYAVSANNTASTELLYVANSTANSITAYPLSASGDVAPTRTIQGPNTGLSNPVAITSDSDGNLIVANALPKGVSTVETFLEGSSGNVAPIRTFSTNMFANRIAINPLNADIYLTNNNGYYDDNRNTGIPGGVDVYDPLGRHLLTLNQAVPPYDPYCMRYCEYYAVGGIASDKRGDLTISEFNASGNNLSLTTFVVPQDAGTSTPALFSFQEPLPGQQINAVSAAAYSKTEDRLVTTVNSQFLYDQNIAANAPISRQANLSSLLPDEQMTQAVAVDTTGRLVFVLDNNGILPFTATSTTFIPGSLITGPNTGLSNPMSMTVAIP